VNLSGHKSEGRESILTASHTAERSGMLAAACAFALLAVCAQILLNRGARARNRSIPGNRTAYLSERSRRHHSIAMNLAAGGCLICEVINARSQRLFTPGMEHRSGHESRFAEISLRADSTRALAQTADLLRVAVGSRLVSPIGFVFMGRNYSTILIQRQP